MEYKIAIPSYNRSKKIVERTLETLRVNLISFSKVWVFVVQSEYQDYFESIMQAFPDFLCDHLVTGVLGISKQRQFIVDFFEEGDHVLNLDDDVEYIDLSFSTYADLNAFVVSAFEDCITHKAFLWSVNPIYRECFRVGATPMTTCLLPCVGGFHGIINRKNLFSISIDEKEDYERTLNHFIHDGVVLRYNRVGYKTVHFSVGGLGGKAGRLETSKTSCDALVERYGEYGVRKIRADGRHEFALKLIKKRQSIAELSKITVYPTYPAELFAPLYERLRKMSLPVKQGTTSRRGFGAHRASTWGLVKQRKSGKVALSYSTKKHPDVWKLVQDIGTALNYEYSSVHMNHNVVCPKHKDSKNGSLTLLVSFGDYEGCNIVIDGTVYDARHTPIVFNGAYLEHWNTPLISGNKYSLVFYHHGNSNLEVLKELSQNLIPLPTTLDNVKNPEIPSSPV